MCRSPYVQPSRGTMIRVIIAGFEGTDDRVLWSYDKKLV